MTLDEALLSHIANRFPWLSDAVILLAGIYIVVKMTVLIARLLTRDPMPAIYFRFKPHIVALGRSVHAHLSWPDRPRSRRAVMFSNAAGALGSGTMSALTFLAFAAVAATHLWHFDAAGVTLKTHAIAFAYEVAAVTLARFFAIRASRHWRDLLEGGGGSRA